MLDSYLNYFRANYTGNRAPIHIGHHFSDYQNGAYRDALKSFARAVCGLPEVRCVTYKTLADFMDGLSPRDARGLSQGRFPRASRSRLPVWRRRRRAQGGNPGSCREGGNPQAWPRFRRGRPVQARDFYAACPASQPSMARLRVSPQ